MRLREKVALITGGASGIGKASALQFAREGAKIVVADIDRESSEKVVAEIQAAGGAAAAVVTDVADRESVQGMIAFCEETFGRLDVLFNNAGIFHPDDGSVLDTGDDIWDRVIDINLKGVFLGCRYGIPAMLRSGGGSIINTASFVALHGSATSQIAYTASKGGVLSMTKEIAVEFARQNIRANAICPGPVQTPLLAELLADPQRRQRRLVHIPIGRFANAEEIASAALFLASDEASYITGSTFTVDGGITTAYVTPE